VHVDAARLAVIPPPPLWPPAAAPVQLPTPVALPEDLHATGELGDVEPDHPQESQAAVQHQSWGAIIPPGEADLDPHWPHQVAVEPLLEERLLSGDVVVELGLPRS
jgi:hypothetical protein